MNGTIQMALTLGTAVIAGVVTAFLSTTTLAAIFGATVRLSLAAIPLGVCCMDR